MKTIKPQKLGLLCKPFENGRECYFVATLLVFFTFDPSSDPLSEVDLWRFVTSELGRDAAFDLCMWKPRGELLVVGRCYTPGGVPRTASSVRVQLGPIDKTLFVIGDRRWGLSGPSAPEPFTVMPVTYENAFGGKGYGQNPIGKGAAPTQEPKGKVHLMPNIELPKHLIRSPGDRPPPAGLGPYDFTWPQRYGKLGTYDDQWLKERFPGFAKDMDWGFFNVAPDDQQINGYFRGDEEILVENMHPEKPRIQTRLPALAGRCFINQKTQGGEVFREIPTRLDTVWLFPHAERGILVFRGVERIAEDDGADVLHLVAGCEDLGSPKPVEHYARVLAQRLDKEKGHLYLLRDRDLLPAPRGSVRSEQDEVDALIATEGLLMKNLRRKAELELEKAREEARRMGLDPALYVPALPPEEPPPNPESLPEIADKLLLEAEQSKIDAEERRAKAEEEAREICKQQGLDYEELVRRAEEQQGGPPKFSAKKEMERLHDMAELSRNAEMPISEVEAKLADPNYEMHLKAVEEQLLKAYKLSAHLALPARRLAGEEGARARERAALAYTMEQSFAGEDLTGADLSGLDLQNADFSDALLEGTSFAGADLSGANFSRAVLARANFSGANLSGAKLWGANLGLAKLRRATIDGADLSSATLVKADLSHATFKGARLSNADLSEAVFEGVDFTGITAFRVNFIGANLSGVKLAGAQMTHCNFLEATVEGVDFTGATLVSSSFVGVKGDRAVFAGANLDNVRVVKESSFEGADFKNARMERANLRGARLSGSDFSYAKLRGADLSESDLRGAKFVSADAVEAIFIRADLTGAIMTSIDLMQGLLQKAKIRGADFQGANLFRVDLAKVEADASTNFTNANVKYVRVVPRGEHG